MKYLASVAAAVLVVGSVSPLMADGEWALNHKLFSVQVYEGSELRQGLLYFYQHDPDYGAVENRLTSAWWPLGCFRGGEYEVLDYLPAYGCYRWDACYRDVPPGLPYDDMDGYYFPDLDFVYGWIEPTGIDRDFFFFGEGCN